MKKWKSSRILYHDQCREMNGNLKLRQTVLSRRFIHGRAVLVTSKKTREQKRTKSVVNPDQSGRVSLPKMPCLPHHHNNINMIDTDYLNSAKDAQHCLAVCV
jgi:hypothetical protein